MFVPVPKLILSGASSSLGALHQTLSALARFFRSRLLEFPNRPAGLTWQVFVRGAGPDTLIGGAGDDSYVVDSTSDVIVENPREGTDAVTSSVTYTLPDNIENLTLTDDADNVDNESDSDVEGTTAINGSGNSLDNVLTGDPSANTLTGNAGNDTLDGRSGADRLVGGTGNDTYLLGLGYGNDLVQENDATAGNTDIGQFLGSVTAFQTWFRHT